MSPAPDSSATENATSTITIAVVNLLSRMPVPVRPPSRRIRMTSGREARIAGTMPASSAENRATPEANSATLPSMENVHHRGALPSSIPCTATSVRCRAIAARTSPPTTPNRLTMRLSAIIWTNSRGRCAPRATRRPASYTRRFERTKMRLATLAQAMSSTSPTAANIVLITLLASETEPSATGTMLAVTPALLRG
ncbi:MAG: hypothetical protein WDO56_32950 [Gammaproteobacteria bacterium]